MTEEAVRTIFFNNYRDGDLNEALAVSIEEISLAIIMENAGSQKFLPDIVRTIIGGKSRIDLLKSVFTNGQTNFVVPIRCIDYFDHVRKAIQDAIRDAMEYMLDNFEAVDQWFKERFTRENLKLMLAGISQAIKASTEMPANVGGLNFTELKLEREFLNMALIGILGAEWFQRYIDEYNKYTAVLRQCQAECEMFSTKSFIKES